MTHIAVIVEGGVVQWVISDDPNAQYIVIDKEAMEEGDVPEWLVVDHKTKHQMEALAELRDPDDEPPTDDSAMDAIMESLHHQEENRRMEGL